MQLVGATEGFIRRPMLMRSIFHGLVSAFMALLLLMFLTYMALEEIPELAELQDPVLLIALVGCIFTLGAMISWFSTWLAVRKYLRIRTDLLYT
jgi:cell division transport system permease protein